MFWLKELQGLRIYGCIAQNRQTQTLEV